MYKYFGLIVGVVMAVMPAQSAEWTEATCNDTMGGTLVTTGGKTFCQAKARMNWWTACAWCEGIGGYLPSIKELCPTREITNSADCDFTYSAVGDWQEGGPWSSTPIAAGSTKMWFLLQGHLFRQTERTSSHGVVCLKK